MLALAFIAGVFFIELYGIDSSDGYLEYLNFYLILRPISEKM